MVLATLASLDFLLSNMKFTLSQVETFETKYLEKVVELVPIALQTAYCPAQ